jgi:hypothetical protein
MMIFLHYADEHPLFTYAFYSPRTKRVLYRQDCIFLTSVFPMRSARIASGLTPDGNPLVVLRSPLIVRNDSPTEYSFADWRPSDPLPTYDDDVTGFTLTSPQGNLLENPVLIPELPVHVPHHSSFGESSKVFDPIPPLVSQRILNPPRVDDRILSNSVTDVPVVDPELISQRPKRSQRKVKVTDAPVSHQAKTTRKPVHQRWFYEPVVGLPQTTLLAIDGSLSPTLHCETAASDSNTDDSNGCTAPSQLPSGLPTAADSLSPAVPVPFSSEGITPPSHDPPEPIMALTTQPSLKSRFTIQLQFPNGEFRDQTYSVTRDLLVSEFKARMSNLMRTSASVVLLVSPHWDILDHSGSVTDDFVPGSASLPIMSFSTTWFYRSNSN